VVDNNTSHTSNPPPCSAWSILLNPLQVGFQQTTYPRSHATWGNSSRRICSVTFPPTSANFNKTLPTKPSQTMTSKRPERTSRPSALPMRRQLEDVFAASGGCARLGHCPFASFLTYIQKVPPWGSGYLAHTDYKSSHNGKLLQNLGRQSTSRRHQVPALAYWQPA